MLNVLPFVQLQGKFKAECWTFKLHLSTMVLDIQNPSVSCAGCLYSGWREHCITDPRESEQQN